MRNFIGLNILLIGIMILRYIFNGKISKRVQYALWLFVPFYIIISLHFNINVTVKKQYYEWQKTLMDEMISKNSRSDAANESEKELNNEYQKEAASDSVIALMEPQNIQNEQIMQRGNLDEQKLMGTDKAKISKLKIILKTKLENKLKTILKTSKTAYQLLKVVSCINITVILLINMIFYIHCRQKRRFFKTAGKLKIKVYLLENISSPFLFGKSIYVPDINHQEMLEYGIVHEYCHFIHGDSFFTILRVLFLGVYWFNPIVWLAVKLMKRDQEMACDEEVLNQIGRDKKEEYGIALIEMLKYVKNSKYSINIMTNMVSKNTMIKERIKNISSPMKRTKLKSVCVMVLSFMITGISLISPCADEKRMINRLGGIGEIKNADSSICAWPVLYDEQNIYFMKWYDDYKLHYYRLTSEGEIYLNCYNKECHHVNTVCESNGTKKYFMFHHTLYSYSDYHSYIIDEESGKAVYKNIFHELSEGSIKNEASKNKENMQDYDGRIKRVSVVNDAYLIVESRDSVNILNTDFNVIYTHCSERFYDRIGKAVHNNIYYYISEYQNLVSVNLDTMETNVIDLEMEVRGIGCDDEGIIFCSERTLYKYTFLDGQCVELYDGIVAGLVNIVDGYTYYGVTSLYGCEKYIIDNNGKFVRDCTDCEKFDMDYFFEVNGVLYSPIHNIGIASMNPDGSNYREYYFEDDR